MKKWGKRLIILVVLAGVLYGGYMVFVMPSGYKNAEELTTDFFTNINQSNACTEYFNPETTTFCESFVTSFEGETVTIDSINSIGGKVNITISAGDGSASFQVTFISEAATDLTRFLNRAYLKIDLIE